MFHLYGLLDCGTNVKQEKLLKLKSVPTFGEFCRMSNDEIVGWIHSYTDSALALGLTIDDDDQPFVRGITVDGLTALSPTLEIEGIHKLRGLVQRLRPEEEFSGAMSHFFNEYAETPFNVFKSQVVNAISAIPPGADYDPTPLLELIEEILADDEVTADEAYALAEYLNENSAARKNWPGDTMVPVLQDVWADGRAEPHELHAIADWLLDVTHQFENHRVEKIDLAASAFARVDTYQALTPSVSATLQVQSDSQPGVFYTVDLESPACTCASWRALRSALPERHISRCCKHILTAFRETQPEDGWPSWIDAFLNQTWTPHPRSKWRVIEINHQPVLVSNAPKGWNAVYALNNKGTYAHYSYSALEDRWAYEDAPVDAGEILQAIHGL